MARPPTSSTPSYGPHRLGALGEALAARRLERAGWRLLARNYRLGRREVDLVARRDDLVVFVEVKTRSRAGFGGPEAAVNHVKRREIETVASHFLVRHCPADVRVRFDVIAIELEPDGRPARFEHLEDAWRPAP